MRRRLLSLAMALAMALSLLPTAALAEEEQPPAGSTVSTESVSNKETQGTPTETSQPVEGEKDVEGSDLADVEEHTAPSNGTVPVPTPASEGNITIPGGTVDTNYTVSTEEGGVVTVTLKSDIILNDTWTIASGETVVLDLSGHALTADNNTVAIKNEGTLTIQDSSNGNGKVSGLRGVDNYGTLTLKSGIITTEDTTGSGGCVFMRGNNASFLVEGGKVSPENTSVNAIGIYGTTNYENMSVTLEGGTIGKIQLRGVDYTLTVGKQSGSAGDVCVGDIDAATGKWVGNVSYHITLNSGTVVSLPNKADTQITYGGTFGTLIQSNDASTLPGGYKFASVDGGYRLVLDSNATPVSIIKNGEAQNYPSMGQALAALQGGDTLRLNKTYQIETSEDCIDVSVPNVTLDLNGFNIEMTKSIAYSPVQVDADGGTFRITNSGTTPAKVQPYQLASYTVAAVSAASSGAGIVTVEVGENITLVNNVELGGGARTKAANLSKDRENLCTVQRGEGIPDGYIYSFNDLDAIASLGDADTPVTVTLLGNATVGVEYTSSTVPMVVDLGGYTVSAASGRSSVISIPDGHDDVNLTVQNGTISGDGVSAASVLSEDCTLILDGLTMTSSGDFGIAANGSSRGSSQSSAGLNLTVRNCSLANTSSSPETVGTETVGIFFPAQEGTLTVENSQITGYNVGVQAFTGTVTITGDETEITGSGVEISNGEEGSLATSGPLFDGAAVSIIQRVNEDGSNPYGEFETVTIDGGTFTTAATGDSAHGALHVSQYKNGVADGAYSDEDFENTPSEGGQKIVQVSGGNFSSAVDAKYCAPGMKPSDEGDGTFTVTADTSLFSSGNGTKDSPFVISTPEQLKAFAESVNSGETYTGKYIELDQEKTFDLSETSWPMIGTGNDADRIYHPFSGHFNGNNCAITGLKISGAGVNSYVGFFGYLSGATVANVNIQNAVVTCNQDNWVGVLAGRADASTISGCIVSGTVTVSDSTPAATVGIAAAGLVEYLKDSTIQNSDAAVNITVSSSGNTVYVGGIACEVSNSEISNCTNQGNLSGYSTSYYSYVGGIASYMKNGSTISECTNTGTITSGDASSAPYATAGGILGQIWAETVYVEEVVSACTNRGTVTAAAQNGASYAGGIVGEAYQYATRYDSSDKVIPWELTDHNDLTIQNCINTGSVSAAGAAAGVLAWGDAEWKLNLTGNSSAQPQIGYYDIPAEVTISVQDNYDLYAPYLVGIETIRLTGNIEDKDGITLEDGQTLIIETDAVFTGSITVNPGATLIQNGIVGGSISTETGSYLITFIDRGTTLGQIATKTDGTINFPDEPGRAGYTFAGWYNGSSKVSSGDKASDAMTLTAQWTAISTPSTPSGGSSTPSYSNTIEVGDGGDVKVSPRTPEAGDTVTITPDPDAGYEVDEVIVTDRNGDAVRVTANRNGTYTFEQPRGRVTIEVTFVRTGDTGLPFLDVAGNAWYYDAVAYAYENGLMSGTASNLFSPNATTTRGMIVTMLYRLEGEPRVSGTSTFDDVADGVYYTDAVIWANANGIVTGYDEVTFGPNDAITREQMAAILYRYAQYRGYRTTGSADLSGYVDADAVSTYALSALQWASAEGLVAGTSSNTLTPDGSATRAQVATIFMRFMEDMAG